MYPPGPDGESLDRRPVSADLGRMDEVESLIGAEDLACRVNSLAGDIADTWPRTADGSLQMVTAIGLLKGAFVFTADLVRALHARGLVAQVDFMTLSSYGTGTERARETTVRSRPNLDLRDRHVLLIDDILDTGHSLDFAVRHLKAELGAASVRSCVLLDKPARREVEIEPDHLGFSIPDRFVVGYGIDWAERFRELPYVGAVKD